MAGNWMRLHEVHRIPASESMAGQTHPAEVIALKPIR
jgi:hypothetical protein